MSEVTLFLLTLIGVLAPANAVLWLLDKRNNSETITYKTMQKPVQKDLILETNELKNRQKNTFSRTIALEDARIQIQNNANETKKLAAKPNNNHALQKTNRIKILEQYLKKT